MALYLYSLSLHSGCGCSCTSSVKGALYLARSQAHCAALSLDWVWPRQPVTLRLSMEDKLQRCTAQPGGPDYRPWPYRAAKGGKMRRIFQLSTQANWPHTHFCAECAASIQNQQLLPKDLRPCHNYPMPFCLPLQDGSWCRNCSSCKISWGSLARQSGWS